MAAGDWKQMFLACEAGDVELVRYHLDAGIDPSFVHAEFQSTALVAAILARHEDVAHLLLDHGADPAQRSDLEGLTALEAAHQVGLAGVDARLRALGVADR
jgi:ankyrin repeat protein